MQSVFFNKDILMMPSVMHTCTGSRPVNLQTFITPFGFVWSGSNLFMPFLQELKAVGAIHDEEERKNKLRKLAMRFSSMRGIIVRNQRNWVESFFLFLENFYIEGSAVCEAGFENRSQVFMSDTQEMIAYNAVHGSKDIHELFAVVKEQTTTAFSDYIVIDKSDIAAALHENQLSLTEP